MTTMQMKLELIPVPVTDVDRAKAFYTEKLGFHADFDQQVREDLRFVQLTPPGSACYSGWFSVDVKVLGVIAILTAVFLVVGALGVLTIPLPTFSSKTE
jgi:catechol 2,3-dioxygenase-like lactoylglutathione lyase family enzyme